MGKETKIGLAVIVALLIVFGVVLAKRVSGPIDAPLVSLSGEKSKTKDNGEEKSAKAGDRKTGSSDRLMAPLVVVPESGSEQSRKSSSPTGSNKWTVASDGEEAKQTGHNSRDESPSPSFMPQPLGVLAAKQYAGQEGTSSAAQQVYDPYQRQATPTGVRPRQSSPVQVAPTPAAPQAIDPISPPLRAATQEPTYSGSGDYNYDRSSRRHTYREISTQRISPDSPGPHQVGQALPDPANPVRRFSATAAGSGGYGVLSGPSDTGGGLNEDGTYTVQPNDNYWAISNRLYGTGGYFKALAEHNRKKHPNEERLQVGDVISAPDASQLAEAFPALCPKPGRKEVGGGTTTVSRQSHFGVEGTYVVQEGDTLYDIARYELGKGSRWPEIHRLNRELLGDDFNHLTPGVQLTLPDDEASDTITRRPGSVYQR